VSDTRPPASLLALYVLGDCGGWRTAGEVANRVEGRTGDRLNAETLRQALTRLADAGRILRRKQVRRGVEIVQYRHPNNDPPNNLESPEVDMADLRNSQ